MKMKKMCAFIMALVVMSSVVPMPVQAAQPEEQIDILVSGEYSDVTLYDSELGIYRFEGENGIGLYSLTSGWITECQWRIIQYTDLPGFFIVEGEDGYGLLDYNGDLVISAEWDMMYLDSGIVVVADDGLWGLMDISGNLLHEATFSSISSFYEGYAKVYKDKKCGFINTSGNYVTDIVWADAQEFSDSLAAVKNQDGLWGYINTQGEVVIPCQYDNASSFRDGYASVLKDDTVYIIQKNNEKVLVGDKPLALEPVYDCLGYIEEVVFYGSQKDIACVLLKGEEKFCYIDKEYNQLTKSIYKYDVEFADHDYCVTIIPNRFGMEKYAVLVLDRQEQLTINTLLSEKKYIKTVDFNGKIFFEADNRLYNMAGYDLFGMEFDKYIYHYDNSDIINAVYKGQYVCVNFDGEVISKLSDYQFYYVSDNLYMATADDGRVKLCDATGKQIAKTNEYAEAYYSNGYIYVKNDSGKWGLCDTDCNVVLEPKYDKLYDISEGMLRYKSKGKYGFINMETKEVIKAIYTNVSHFHEGYCWVSKDVLIGAIDKNGDYIIKPLYWGDNDCTGFGGNNFVYGVTSLRKDKNGNYGVVNQKGQKLLDFVYSYISAFGENGVAFFSKEEGDTRVCGLMQVAHNDSEILPTKITTDKSKIVVYEGCYEVITETVTPETAADLNVSFASANEDVAVVDEVGRVYGVSEGQTVIVLVSQAAGPSVVAVVEVEVVDRTLYDVEEMIPQEQWEGQTWLSNIVLDRLGELGISKTTAELTYGDLLEVKHIRVDEMEDPGEGIVYHIPEIIGEFSNLMTVDISPDIFIPLISTKPDSVKYLSNLESWNITNTYGDTVNEMYIRNNDSGIPDKNLYKALANGQPVYKNSSVSDLRFKEIENITGLSQLEIAYTLDLSCNYITDISELGALGLSDRTIDLSYNQLDLSNEATMAVITSLEENGCTVITEGQNEIAVIFAQGYSIDWEWIGECPMEFRISIAEATSRCYKFYIHNGSEDDLQVVSTDPEIAKGYIEKNEDGSYYWGCQATGIGEANLYLMEKATGKILYDFPTTISEPRFWAEEMKVSYEVWEYSPYYAMLRCENGYQYIEYRLQGTNTWNRYEWPTYISQNGTYELRYCNWYGRMSDIVVLEITGIKQLLTEQQMPDPNLRNCFNGGNVYEGYKVTWLNTRFNNISDLKGISLLDFSELDEWSTIDFSYNQISDISELAKLDISNRYIDLSYNRIDFTQPANAAALQKLYKRGCTVYMTNQFYDEEPLFVGIGSYQFTATQPNTYWGTIQVYQGDVKDVSLQLRGGEIVTDFVWQNYGQHISYHFNYGSVYGTEYIDVYYQGELVKTAEITVQDEWGSQAETLNMRVDNYYEGLGFYVQIDTWGYSYEYRNQSEENWRSSNNSSFYIAGEGTYEFRVQQADRYITGPAIELRETNCDGLNLILNHNGWKVYGIDAEKLNTKLVVPEIVDGYPITDISGITNAPIKTLHIPKTVTTFGYFNGCSELNKITMDEANPYYYVENNCIIGKADHSLVSYMANAGVLEIPEGVERVSTLGGNAKKLILPSSICEFSGYAIMNLYMLEEIQVHENNGRFHVQDGVLYERYTGRLMACPSAKTNTLVIPEQVLFIGYYAFRNSKLTEVYLPKTLIGIEGGAFDSCYNLESITLRDEIVKIDSNAFWNCSKLTNVYYSGTQQSWEQIRIEQYGNEALLNANLQFICSCGTRDTNYVIYKAASCTQYGKAYYACVGCGAKEYVTLDLLRHNFVDGVCKICSTECSVVESEHNYADNMDESWTVTKEGAKEIAVTFSSDTMMEPSDYVYVYDGQGEQIASNLHETLASKTITVPGDTVTIRMTSDSSGNNYGFYAEVYAINLAEYETGDINGDGTADIRDVVRMKKVFAGEGMCKGSSTDMNVDGKNNAKDLVVLRKLLVKLISFVKPQEAIQYNVQYVSYDEFDDEQREEYVLRELCFDSNTLCHAKQSWWAKTPGMQGEHPLIYNGKTYYGGDGGGNPFGCRFTENEIVILDYVDNSVVMTIGLQDNGDLKVLTSNSDAYRVGSIFTPEK